jgi:hypothetical protein
MKSKRREIELYIDELLLEGFAASERHAIADALKLELENLLRDSSLATRADLSTFQLDRLNAGSITVQALAQSDRLGTQLGRVLFQSLNGVVSADRASKASAQANDAVHPVHSERSSK